MLTRIASEHETGVLLGHTTQQLDHLTSTDLPALIHDDQCPRGQFLLLKELRHGTGRRESGSFHVHNLLTLRGKHDNLPAC